MLGVLGYTGIFFCSSRKQSSDIYERDKKQKQKKSPPTEHMSFEVVMLTPIVKRRILIKEIFGFIKNHKSYASLKFLSSE
jgi:hypothetical protein